VGYRLINRMNFCNTCDMHRQLVYDLHTGRGGARTRPGPVPAASSSYRLQVPAIAAFWPDGTATIQVTMPLNTRPQIRDVGFLLLPFGFLG